MTPARVTIRLQRQFFGSHKGSSYTLNHRIEWQSLTLLRFPSTVTITRHVLSKWIDSFVCVAVHSSCFLGIGSPLVCRHREASWRSSSSLRSPCFVALWRWRRTWCGWRGLLWTIVFVRLVRRQLTSHLLVTSWQLQHTVIIRSFTLPNFNYYTNAFWWKLKLNIIL